MKLLEILMTNRNVMIKKRALIGVVASLISFCATNSTLAAPGEIRPADLPGSVNPGVVGADLQSKSVMTPVATAPAAPAPEPEKKESTLGSEATKIKFKLNKIILEENKTFSNAQLTALYKDKIGKVITVGELEDIVKSITNYYRNSGYILSRAIIPPQHVKDGIVKIRIVEGYIGTVTVIGKPRGAKALIQTYGNRITLSRPLQIKEMERNLFIINEIPGVQAKAVLEPSKLHVGASDLALAAESQLLSSFISYDNYGTRYIGPQEITAGVTANSIFRSGDSTRVTYVTTSKGNELQYKDLYHETPIGPLGWRAYGDANISTTNPLFTLQPVQIAGLAKDYNGGVRYPYIRSREKNLTIEAGFNYLDSYTTQFDFPLYTDHIRSLHGSLSYDFADRFKGSNMMSGTLVQGLPLFGGTTDNQSFTTSRYGATSKFTKLAGQVNRLQKLFWRFSAYGTLKGQYSLQPLLASEQMGYGGSQLGRGYDPAEIIGDRGMAGSLEIRLDTVPAKFFVQAIQYYYFYDMGKVWNIRNVASTPSSFTATSTGMGARFYMTKYLSGNFMYTQPLSRKVQSLQQIGNGSRPRMFFSITAAV